MTRASTCDATSERSDSDSALTASAFSAVATGVGGGIRDRRWLDRKAPAVPAAPDAVTAAAWAGKHPVNVAGHGISGHVLSSSSGQAGRLEKLDDRLQ